MAQSVDLVLEDIRAYLIEHRDELLDSYCASDERGAPRRDTMDPCDAAHVERVDILIEQAADALGLPVESLS
jgi:hypothetical protein